MLWIYIRSTQCNSSRQASNVNDFKRGHQPRSNLVKDENGYLFADSHNILNRWKNYFSQWRQADRNMSTYSWAISTCS
jgi:hypothetical protein